MGMNRQAYEAAYRRALAGKSSHTVASFFLSPFEDEYTRQSRRQGERDGRAAREAAATAGGEASPPAA